MNSKYGDIRAGFSIDLDAPKSTEEWQPDHVVSRNCKRLEHREIEVKRYNDGGLREVLFMILVVIGGWIIKDVVLQEGYFWEQIEFALYHNEVLEEQYYRTIHPLVIQGRLKCTLEEFQQEMVDLHYSSIREGWIITFLPLGLFILYGFPAFRPVRYDPIRRIIYFRRFGRFAIHHIPIDHYNTGLNLSRPEYIHKGPRISASGNEALCVYLPLLKKPDKKMLVDMGVITPVRKYQSQELHGFLLDYMERGGEQTDRFAQAFKSPGLIKSDFLRWIQYFSLFPALGYNKKKTERAIAQFFEKNNIVDMRKWYLDHPNAPGNPLTEDAKNSSENN